MILAVLSVSETTALLTAVSLFLAQLASIYISLKNGTKADLISGRVDGQLTAANTKIAALHDEVQKLTSDKAEMKGMATVLASKIPSDPPNHKT